MGSHAVGLNAAIVGDKLLKIGGTFRLPAIFWVKITARISVTDDSGGCPYNVAVNLEAELIMSSWIAERSPRFSSSA